MYSWNSSNRSHFSKLYMIIPAYSPSYTLSLYHPHSHSYQSLKQVLVSLNIFCFLKKIMISLFV
jgi:hypothetical protein